MVYDTKITLEETVERIITNWLEKELHNKNAIPKLMLAGMAKEIAEHGWEIYSYVDTEYLMNDIDSMAENMGETLTDGEKDYVAYRYRKIDDSNLDSLEYIIEEVVKDRKEKQQ